MTFDSGEVVVFQGDSITDCGRMRDVTVPNDLGGLGYGYAKMAGARLLAEFPGADLKIYNRGVSGNQVDDLAARWEEDCLALAPTTLSILIGVNDTFAQFDHGTGLVIERFRKTYRSLLEGVRAVHPDVRLVLCEPFVLVTGLATPEHRDEVSLRQQVVRRMAGDFDAQYVAFQACFDGALGDAPPPYWAPDGVHPTAAGHALMAEHWLKAVLHRR